jgi:hypothetical protein
MGLIEYYIIFALTTAITSCIEFLAPATAKAKELGINNSFTTHTWLSYIIYVTTCTIFAPIIILPIILPNANKKFRTGLEKVVLENDK